eukprot:TRINITY_DN30560_c0_g1_i1.p1 TRINITY_DN30560_c0_g1~~TRINITY_DN30560_c0_g1_i1.p1  ORF type:complete len:133 (-),score=9.97 TRINITY_DN30560_c0_g1_i1:186-584(-)
MYFALPASIQKQYISLLDDAMYDDEVNIMDIMSHISKLQDSISFLYYLCNSLKFIDGVSILQFLYETILKSIENQQSLTIYLFQSCFEPLIDIICSWIYCGELNDFYNEIAVQNQDKVTFNKLPLFLEFFKQ